MPLFRRRPLLRAAAVGGGAYYMGKRHAEGQEQQADQEQRIENLESQPAPATASASGGGISADSVQRLQELGKLHEQGILTDSEFSAQKERVLAG
jgi:hypothetical protein